MSKAAMTESGVSMTGEVAFRSTAMGLWCRPFAGLRALAATLRPPAQALSCSEAYR
jgi:hypothetical protein